MPRNSGGSFLHRRIPSRLEAVDDTCREIRLLLVENGLKDVCFAVDLLAREFLQNAVIHGNGSDADKVAIITMRIGRKWICLHIADEGPGFDWRRTRRTPPSATTVNGRGLPIGALYAQRMSFNRRGNQVTLWINKQR
jgi:serine/threonine-protein kinase RsbW